MNEVESGGKRGVTLSAFSFLVGVLLGISILFGILLVHRYKYDDNLKENINNKANETLENLDNPQSPIPNLLKFYNK